MQRELGDRLVISRQNCLERLALLQLWSLFHEHRHALEAVHDLCIHGMLNPKRPVLVERGNARLRRHEGGFGAVDGSLNKGNDRLLRQLIIP